MQDQTRARRPKAAPPTIRPETIPDLARYLGISTETLAQLTALHALRQRQGERDSRAGLS